MGSSPSYRSQNTQVPFLHRGNPTKKYVSLWISAKSTPWEQMIILTKIIQSAFCQMQHNTWQGSHYSASLTSPKLTTVCRWRNNIRWKCFRFDSASRTLACKRLAKGLSRSVSAFFTCMREYLDPVVKADECAQYLDYIGIAANNAVDLIRNLQAVF